MHAVYKTNNTWTISQVIIDLCSLLTGTSDINTLSPSCDKTQTNIVTSVVPADWTYFDTVASPSGTSGMNSITYLQVLSRQGSRDTLTKYAGLGIYSNTYFSFSPMTTWNNTTHVGADWWSYVIPNFSTTLPIIFYIWVGPSYIFMLPYQNGSWSPKPFISFELNRDELKTYSDWWNESNGKSICCAGSMDAWGANIVYVPLPRIKKSNTTGEAINNTVALGKPFNLSYAQRNVNETNGGILLSPFYATCDGAYYGTVNDLLYIATTVSYSLNMLDEFTYGGKTYQVITTNSFYFALPKE